MSIDWRKAPDWANQVGASTSGFAWIGEDRYMFFETNVLRRWGAHGSREPEFFHLIDSRTSEWTGEGLPPVGTVCEHRTGPGMSWSNATVLAYGDKKVFYRDQDGHEWTRLYDEIDFRPIRTAEQIAAEEREKAIADMAALSPLLDKGWSRRVCEAVYEAGYRKQETAQ